MPVDRVVDHQVIARTGDAGVITLATSARVLTADGAEVAAGEGELRLPVGGPYTIEQDDGCAVHDVFVGDLWLIGGQSNAAGAGLLRDLEMPGPCVRLFGMDRRWQPVTEPLHRLWRSPDAVHHGLFTPEQRAGMDAWVDRTMRSDTPAAGAGFGVAFANEMVALTGVPVGLIPAAQGATSIAQWAPGLPDGGGETLYGSMLAAARAAGGRITGLLWHQGEAESLSDETVRGYVPATRAVFEALRADLAQPDLRVYLAQIGGFPILRDHDADRRWTGVANAQRDPIALGAHGVAATVDLGRSDPIHLDTAGQRRLGRRFARLAAGRASTIDLAETNISGRLADWPTVMETMTVRLRFRGVTGALHPSSNIGGFSVRDADEREVRAVWNVTVDPSKPDTVVVRLAGPSPEGGAFLWHGWGTAPHCMLVDDADMAVPSFGPVPLNSAGVHALGWITSRR